MAGDHGAPQRDSFTKNAATFSERLLLLQRGDFAPELSILLLHRFAGQGPALLASWRRRVHARRLPAAHAVCPSGSIPCGTYAPKMRASEASTKSGPVQCNLRSAMTPPRDSAVAAGQAPSPRRPARDILLSNPNWNSSLETGQVQVQNVSPHYGERYGPSIR